MNLYLLKNGLGNFYVVAESFDKAKEKLTTLLNEGDYGFYQNRVVKEITLLATEVSKGLDGKPSFSETGIFA